MVFSFSVLFFFLLIFLFDVTYLFHGVRATYLRGEVSAQIDDSKFFYNRSVLAKSPKKIPKGETTATISSKNNAEILRLIEKKYVPTTIPIKAP